MDFLTNSNITDLVIVQDRSGSMDSIRSDAEGGINSFIKEQSSGPGQCYVTFVEFDNTMDTLYLRRQISFVNPYTLSPRGGTALLDAIGFTITRLGNLYASLPEEDRPGKIYFVVNTDGQENQSREFSKFKINEMITHQRERYGWEFVFLAANQDAIQTGTQIGFAAGSSVSYTASAAGTRNAYAGASASIMNSRVGGQSVNFTDEQREGALEE